MRPPLPIPGTATAVALAAASLTMLCVGAATPARADQPVFNENPEGVAVQVRTHDTPDKPSGDQPNDPAVTHVSCQYQVGHGAGGLILRGVCSNGTAGATVFDPAGNGSAAGQPFPTPPPPAPEPLPGPVVTPEALARQAYRFLPLPPPAIRTNPPTTRDQLVNLPTRLWTDRAAWGVRTATASVPGLAVTVTATPVVVVWRMGDGGTRTCHGPGTPFDPGADRVDPPGACSYTYRRSSAGTLAGRFRVTATTTWRVAWTSTGTPGSGTLPPLSRSSQTALRVAEVQAINTH